MPKLTSRRNSQPTKKVNDDQPSGKIRESLTPATIIGVLGLIVSISSLLTTWYLNHAQGRSIDTKLKGIQDSIRILSLDQGSNIQAAVERALDAKLAIPPQQLEQAQSTAKLLTSTAPDSEVTWRTVAAVANYRSASFRGLASTAIPTLGCEHGQGAYIPLDKMQDLMQRYPNMTIVSGCTVHLDTFHPAYPTLFLGATVLYSGGTIPHTDLIFEDCDFRFTPVGIPQLRGKNLMTQLLTVDLTQPIRIDNSTG